MFDRKSLWQAGDKEKTKQILEEALVITKSIKEEPMSGELMQIYALRSIARTAGQLGNAEKTKQILEKLSKLSNPLKMNTLLFLH